MAQDLDLSEDLAEQLYYVAARGEMEDVFRLLEEGADPNHPVYDREHVGQTPLHWACFHDCPEAARKLIDCGAKVDARDNAKQQTPLHWACWEGSLSCVKVLLSHSTDDLGTVDGQGYIPLGIAVRWGRLEVVKCLITEQNINPKGVVDTKGRTPLAIAVARERLNVVDYLITEQNIHPESVVDRDGETPMSIAVRCGKLLVVKYLILEHNIDPKGALLLACKCSRVEIVRYLLTDLNCNPNITDKQGHTPLSLARNNSILQLLLKHGAVTADAYKLHRKILGKFLSKDPLQNPVNMFVIGRGGEGKTTLIEAMQHEPRAGSFSSHMVSEVVQRTAGIVPSFFKSKMYGLVQFFDFAGQEAYYSSHAALIRSMVDICPPVFLLVIGMHHDHDTISQSVSYWLGVIQNQCTSMEGKAPLIVIGSHADVLKRKGEDPESKKQMITQFVNKYSKFELMEFLTMDCRYSNSLGIRKLRNSVETCCVMIRSRLTVTLNAHMFLLYLLDKFKRDIAVTIEDIQAKIEIDLHQNQSKKTQELLYFIPTTLARLVEICSQLNDKGHILFLRNPSSAEKSFVIIDKTALFDDISGTIFAPDHFDRYCQLGTSTGVVTQSTLSKYFSRFDVNMLVKFTTYLELSILIEDEKVLSLINQQLATHEAPLGESYLFFPALIRVEAPQKVWKFDEHLNYHFGWLMACAKSDQFFDIRCFQVLLLRLALSLHLAISIDETIRSLRYFCSVWKRGVCWCNNDGITSLVEIDSCLKTITIQMRSRTLTPECLRLRSQVINKVRDAANELCSAISTVEFLIDPTEVVQYPMKPSPELSLYPLNHVAETIVSCKTDVESQYKTLPLNELLQLEVYSDLGENILQPIFSNAHDRQKLSDQLITSLSGQVSKDRNKAVMLKKILHSQCTSSPILQATPSSDTEETMEVIFKKWRDESEGTYMYLREIMNQHSVFAGMSPLKLAKVKDDLTHSVAAVTSGDDVILPQSTSDYNIQGDRETLFVLQQPPYTAPLNVIDHLRPVRSVLWDVRWKWFDLGLELDIDEPTLQAIKRTNHYEVDDCFTSMISHYLKRHDPLPTWSHFVIALRSPPVNHPLLADRLMEMAKRESGLTQTL